MQCLLSYAASRLDRLAILMASQLIALKKGAKVPLIQSVVGLLWLILGCSFWSWILSI